jgi:hypothetical protein
MFAPPREVKGQSPYSGHSYAAHKIETAAVKKAYRKRHAAKLAQYFRSYRQRNRAKLLEYGRKYRLARKASI